MTLNPCRRTVSLLSRESGFVRSLEAARRNCARPANSWFTTNVRLLHELGIHMRRIHWVYCCTHRSRSCGLSSSLVLYATPGSPLNLTRGSRKLVDVPAARTELQYLGR
jgi:hypothetical protein